MPAPLTVSTASALLNWRSVLASVPWGAQWKFNNDGTDSIGSNHLTATNSPTFTTDKSGATNRATQLAKASSQYWSVADNAALSIGANNMCMAAWVYMDSLPGAASLYQVCGKWGNDTNNREYVLVYDKGGFVGGSNAFRFGVSSDGVTSTSVTWNAVASLSTWYLVICRYDGVNIYISVNDGTEVSAAYSSGIFDGTSRFAVGTLGASGASFPLDGRVDNCVVAKGAGAALSQAQRDALYAAGVGTEAIQS